MCHDGNSASLSVRYLNSQLTALWENANECMKSIKDNSWDVRSEKYERSKYTRALAQFHYFGKKAPKQHGSPSSADFHFYATFGKPELKFICNHDAVLFLKIEEGHVNLDYNKITTGSGGIRADAQKNKRLHDVKVAYRFEFERSKLKGRDTRIGNADSKHLIQLTILKFETAKLIDIESKKELGADTKAALQVYLTKYLDFLRRAGSHVFFDLPDFDDDKFQATIDYSQHQETLNLERFCGGITVKSIDLTDINEQLARKWAAAHRLFLTGVEDKLSASLAVFSSQWLPNSAFDAHFYIQFRAPRVQALCSHEVILYLDIARVWFFDGENFSTAKRDYFENWTIAFIVDVIEAKTGSVTELKLDFEKARISRIHSTQVSNIERFNLLISFFSADYFEILITYSMHVMFHLDVLATGFGGLIGYGGGGGYASGHESGSASWSDSDSEDDSSGRGGAVIAGGAGAVDIRIRGQVSIYASMIMKLSLFGFDQITALSEEAMNTVFASLYREARVKGHVEYSRIYQWEKVKLFSATFGGISVHLLSGNKALIGITIDSGSIYTKKETRNDEPWIVDQVINYFWPKETDETSKYDFGELTLAYEVDINLVDDEELVRTDFNKRFRGSDLYQAFRGKTEWYRFKHLVLDVRNARFVEGLSNITAFGKDTVGVTRLELVQRYIREYLENLANSGYNVVQSLPFLSRPELERESYAFTSIAYQVVSKTTVTIKNCTYKRSASEAPALLIYGMCGGRPMPNALIQWLTSWIIPGGRRRSFGTVCLSKAIFLEGRLLRLLEVVNRKTTLVPKFAGVIDGKSYFDLAIWDEDVYRKNKKCLWKAKAAVEGYLEYVWEHRDEWSHEHEGTDEKGGEYSLACRTKNKLIIPTAYRADELKITLSGESSIKVKGNSDHQKWSKKTTASWEVTIVVHSKPTGLFVSASVVKAPDIKESDVEGICDVDLVSLHQQNLHLIDFKNIEYELNSILAGAWQYSSSSRHRYALYNPVFTREGDLIVQLTELKKGLLANGSTANGAAGTTVGNDTYSSLVVQAAKYDLNSAKVSAGNGLSTPSIPGQADNSPAKALPVAPDVSAATKAAPGFNPSLKTGSPPKSTPPVSEQK